MTMHIKFLKPISSSAILLALAMPAAVQAQDAAQVSPDAPYAETVFFGDGYTDAGFFRPLLPSSVRPITAQFLDNPGNVWAQFLADYYQIAANPNGNGQTVTDYAVGGARVGLSSASALGPIPSLTAQLNTYLTSGDAT
jgi:outer membrane lipase/esterase